MSKQEVSHVLSCRELETKWLNTKGVLPKDMGVLLPTFSYWIQKYQKQLQQEGTNNFIIINKEHQTDCKQYGIIYPNGVTFV